MDAAMNKITRVEISQVDLAPKVRRGSASRHLTSTTRLQAV